MKSSRVVSISINSIQSGGKSSNVVEEYDEEKNQWHKLTSLNVQSSVYLIELKPDVEKHWFNWYVI